MKIKARTMLDKLLYLCIIVITVAVLVSAYWEFKPYKTLVVNKVTISNPVAINGDLPVIKRGSAIFYKINYCKYVTVQAVLFRELVGSNNHYPIPVTTGNVAVAPGCGEYINSNALIDPSVAPGTYYMDIVAQYQVNPIRKVAYRYRTPLFEVQ